MVRPVKPGPLFVLTLLMLYPGLTLAYQGGYPFLTGEWFSLKGQLGSWMIWGKTLGMDRHLVSWVKLGLGLAWLAGVPGLWAGSQAAYGLTLLACAGTLAYDPPKGALLGLVGLACLVLGRQRKDEVVLT